MKMSILEFEYRNIRKISSLHISFLNSDGCVIKNNFVMMANGTGKTTTIRKLSNYYIKKGYTPVIAASDTFRAGAIEQVQYHADNLGVKYFSGEYAISVIVSITLVTQEFFSNEWI